MSAGARASTVSAVANDIANAFVNEPDGIGQTEALLVMQRGQVVLERYGADVAAHTTLVSWSMAKSVTQAIVGLLVTDGLLDIDAPAPVAQWADDARREITVAQLLNMRSGLRFEEEYTSQSSDVVEMLFGTGKDDVAGFAAAMPLEYPPGTQWAYASGTTNIICRIVGDIVGGGADGMRAYVNERLFAPLGMTTATIRFDTAGTFIGSSFMYASALDYARFGELYRLDGVWDGRRILPQGWVDQARTPTPTPADEAYGYGSHWWLWPYPGSFAAHGYEGQHIVVVPDRELVVVRLATTPDNNKWWPRALLHRLIEAFAVTA